MVRLFVGLVVALIGYSACSIIGWLVLTALRVTVTFTSVFAVMFLIALAAFVAVVAAAVLENKKNEEG